MSSRRLPTGTVSPPSREERVRPRSDGSATDGSSGAVGADELARENQRLRRENRRLRERLDAERTERQAVIDRYEGLVDDTDAPGRSRTSARTSSTPSRRTRRSPDGAGASLASALDRLARLLGLR